MMNNYFTNDMMGVFGGPAWMAGILPLMLLAVLWNVFWKGLALWHAGRRGDVAWFIAILVINLFGVVEIIYLFGIAKLKFSELFSKKVHNTA